MKRRPLLFPLAMAAMLIACRGPHVYPPQTTDDFLGTCRREMYPGGGNPSLARVEGYCQCLLQWCRSEWNAEELNRVLVRSASGGWAGMHGGLYRYPSSMQEAMAHCKTKADEGK